MVRIKHFLANSVYKVKYLFDYYTGLRRVKEQFKVLEQKRCFLMGTPEHDNLGDHAIALAEYQFLEQYFQDYEVIEIPLNKIFLYKRALKKFVKKDDFFMITGGGNMGSVYKEDECVRRWVGKEFSDSLMVVMPQTIHFSNDQVGITEKALSVKCYDKPTTLLVAREKQSYIMMKEIFKTSKVMLCPDMVFSLDVKDWCSSTRDGIGMCLRNDCEAKLTSLERDKIINLLQEKDDIVKIDTCNCSNVMLKERKSKVLELVREISGVDFFVTDRLHGMIFATITNTPCVVFGNANHKITSSIKWLAQYNYIILAENIDDLQKCIDNAIEVRVGNYELKNFRCYYEKIANSIRGMI